jgi:hypothetical protein
VAKKEKTAIDYHRNAFTAHLRAYNSRPSMEQAAFDMAVKHATIFMALKVLATETSK